MNKYLLFVSSFLVTLISISPARAAAQVSYLNVDGTTLVFSTDEIKTFVSPGCVLSDYAENWALDLTTQAGISSYNILLTAVANNLKVAVETAGDCGASDGIERPKSVALSS
ncbi:hypothetical protein [Thalassomonas sp. RHCl1]|uniref:hypothetical protein n=1 Tax=Thalassomonas sp. RHCl1 TaxID=2995320 RepID=UPI00248AAA47|nr:hypothetical protein [Thalassomonas sp. RHCl1]